jgi:hypothetical protein
MFFYRGYSLIIGSELQIPELPPAQGEPDVVIRFGTVPRPAGKASVSDERAFHTSAGAFHIIDGRQIVIDPLPGADVEVLRVILIGRMMAYLLRQRGWLSLHASAVSINDCGMLFLGASGAGKSTVAAAFHSRGHKVISDDVSPVRASRNRCIALPSRPRLRLDERARSIVRSESAVAQWDKYLVDVTRGGLPDSIEVKRIYVLRDGCQIGTQEISVLASVRLLSAHSFFRRGRMDEASLRGHLRQCADVAEIVSLRYLTRPRLLTALPDVVGLAEKEAEELRRGSK